MKGQFRFPSKPLTIAQVKKRYGVGERNARVLHKLIKTYHAEVERQNASE